MRLVIVTQCGRSRLGYDSLYTNSCRLRAPGNANQVLALVCAPIGGPGRLGCAARDPHYSLALAVVHISSWCSPCHIGYPELLDESPFFLSFSLGSLLSYFFLLSLHLVVAILVHDRIGADCFFFYTSIQLRVRRPGTYINILHTYLVLRDKSTHTHIQHTHTPLQSHSDEGIMQ
ncbi:hypothetical protein F4809DRAFT_628467 [Biscogniauxia mediterranea]|nr:hypothetical protein F4809DRAFT_628467 [Biscogniauxia mediterranea]